MTREQRKRAIRNERIGAVVFTICLLLCLTSSQWVDKLLGLFQ